MDSTTRNRYIVIGIGPEYNYPGNYDLWREDNTRYASNYGASLISRSIAKEFNGVYTDDLSSPSDYNQYKGCIICFATHITGWRDVSEYTDFIDALKIPVYLFSLGISDYVPHAAVVQDIHPSMKRLLEIISERSAYIGCRGHYTASRIYGAGIKNVLPIGCPTLYSNLEPEFDIKTKEQYDNPGVVYHRTMADANWPLIKGLDLVGQDFLDNGFFNDDLKDDKKLIEYESREYSKYEHHEDIVKTLKENGFWPRSFDEWWNRIGSHDFIFGARLHGCIGALLQGIPAILCARDLRVQEIAEFFALPYVNYDELEAASLNDLYEKADYSEFKKTFKSRYKNFEWFIKENGLSHNLIESEGESEYTLGVRDYGLANQIVHSDIYSIRKNIEQLTERMEVNEGRMNKVVRLTRKFPRISKTLKRLSGN